MPINLKDNLELGYHFVSSGAERSKGFFGFVWLYIFLTACLAGASLLRSAVGELPGGSFGDNASLQLSYFFSYLLYICGLWIFIEKYESRSFQSLINAFRGFRTRLLLMGGAILAVSVALIGGTGNFVPDLSISIGANGDIQLPQNTDQIVLYMAALPVVMSQCFSEELLFRGYLPQAISGSQAPRMFGIMIVSSLIFGICHIGHSVWWAPALSGLHGALYFRAMWLTGGIEFPLGMHFVNNMIALSGVGMNWNQLNYSLTARDALLGFLVPTIAWAMMELLFLYRPHAFTKRDAPQPIRHASVL